MMNQYFVDDVPVSLESGKTFPSTFIQKYMVNNFKYRGGGLGKTEQDMSNFSNFLKTQLIKIGLGSDGHVKQKWGSI